MVFIVNPPVGAFNTWLNDMLAGMGEGSRLLLGAVLGGMMAVDFGGPFNKAAYVFGTASIASGQYEIMASVMIGGMVPPIAIALATTFFKKSLYEERTTDDDHKLYYGTFFYYRRSNPACSIRPTSHHSTVYAGFCGFRGTFHVF